MPYTGFQNLIIAERVVDYVEGKMTHGASNKPIDLTHSRMKFEKENNVVMRWFKSPDLTAGSVNAQRAAARLEPRLPTRREEVLRDALRVEASGIGNCGEQSAVAYRYLREVMQYADPFCYIGLGRNHSCLVLGDSAAHVAGNHPLANPPAWNAAAVICDPWYHEWFLVSQDWTRKVRSILSETEPGVVQGNILVTATCEGH